MARELRALPGKRRTAAAQNVRVLPNRDPERTVMTWYRCADCGQMFSVAKTVNLGGLLNWPTQQVGRRTPLSTAS